MNGIYSGRRHVHGRNSWQPREIRRRLGVYHRCEVCGIEYAGQAGARRARSCAERDRKEGRG